MPIFSAMPKIIYHYYPVKSLGEAPRLLLAYGGEGFEDNRISGDVWAAFKPRKHKKYICYRIQFNLTLIRCHF